MPVAKKGDTASSDPAGIVLTAFIVTDLHTVAAIAEARDFDGDALAFNLREVSSRDFHRHGLRARFQAPTLLGTLAASATVSTCCSRS